MRFINTSNGYIEFVEQINDSIVNSSCFPIGSVYCRLTNGTKLTFFLGYSNEPYKKQIFDLDFPISLNGEFYRNYADIQEVLGELFGEPNKELKEKVAEIEENLNVALTNLENNTEDIETLQGQMDGKADLSEVYTQERVDLLLNLKVDNSTLQNQYYDKNATDAKLALKSDKADTYNKTDVNNLLNQKANASDVDLLETQIDSINDDLVLKVNKDEVYAKAQMDSLLGEKANIDSVYNKSEIDIKLDEKADKSNTYSKTETNDLLNEKANVADLSLKADKTQIEDLNNNISQVEQEVDTLIEDVTTKASKEDVYTKSETNGLLNEKADKEWTETEISSLWSSNSNHQVQLDSKANASEVYTKSETEELLNGKANTSDLDNYYTKSEIDEMIDVDPTPTPTGETGTLCMTLSSDVADTNIYQNDGETIKQALDRYLGDTFGYDGDYDDLHCREFKSSITHVAFSNNITQIESTNVGLFGYGTDEGYGQYDGGWNNIVSVTLPNNLQTIGNYVFQIMPKVSQWNIPSTVTSIGNAAFERRTQDPNVNRTIRFNSNSCPSLGNSSFDIVDEEEMMVDVDTNQTFKVNCGYLSDYSSTFINMGGSYEIYSANKLITEDCAEPEPTGETETHVIFYDENGDEIASLEGLSPYSITQSAVEGLGESVKENCRKVLFGYNVKSISEKAFLGFDKVNEWTIQNRDTTEIGNFAFARTDNSTVRTFIFTNAVTPLNTETLGNNVFDRTKEGIISLAADENTYFKVNGCDALFNLYETLENKDGYYSQYIERVSNLIDEECH